MLEAGAFAGSLAQVVKLGAMDAGVAVNQDTLDAGGAGQESALHADAVAGDSAHGEIGIISAPAQADHSAFELLGSFVCTFFNAEKYTHGVARAQFGDIGIYRGFDSLD